MIQMESLYFNSINEKTTKDHESLINEGENEVTSKTKK